MLTIPEGSTITPNDDARAAFFEKIKPEILKKLASCQTFNELTDDFKDGFWFGAEAATVEIIDQLTEFEDGGQNFSEFIDTQETLPEEIKIQEPTQMDKIIETLNSYKKTLCDFGLNIDWHYRDFSQALDSEQISVDIFICDKIGSKKTALEMIESGMTFHQAVIMQQAKNEAKIMITLEKDDEQNAKAIIEQAIIKLWRL